MVAPTCSDCHGATTSARRPTRAAASSRTNVPATCGTCHEGIAQQVQRRRPRRGARAGQREGAGLPDCHTAHAIQRAESTAWQLEVIGQCGTCHVNRIATYRDTFHGQVTHARIRARGRRAPTATARTTSCRRAIRDR